MCNSPFPEMNFYSACSPQRPSVWFLVASSRTSFLPAKRLEIRRVSFVMISILLILLSFVFVQCGRGKAGSDCGLFLANRPRWLPPFLFYAKGAGRFRMHDKGKQSLNVVTSIYPHVLTSPNLEKLPCFNIDKNMQQMQFPQPQRGCFPALRQAPRCKITQIL